MTFWLRSTKTTGGHFTSFLQASARAPSGPHFLLNGLLIFGIICPVTLLICPPSLHSSAQLNVLISVIFLISNSCSAIWFYRLNVFCAFTRVFIVPVGRLLVLNFQPCQPATCYFICCIGILCSQQINDDDDDDVYSGQ